MSEKMNIIHTLKEKIISKLTLEDKKDIIRLTITGNAFEQITFSTLHWMFNTDINPDSDDPLDFSTLIDNVLIMRTTEKGRSRKDIKEVYTGWEFRSDVKQQVSTPRPSDEEVKPKRRWL